MTVSFFSHPSPIVPFTYALYLIAVFLSGIGCGATGIGGVFLTPILILLHVEPKAAVAAVVTSFAPTVAITIFQQRKVIHVKGSLLLSLGALPGATLGALLLPHIPSSVISVIVSIVALFAGFNTLRENRNVFFTRDGFCQEGKEVKEVKEIKDTTKHSDLNLEEFTATCSSETKLEIMDAIGISADTTVAGVATSTIKSQTAKTLQQIQQERQLLFSSLFVTKKDQIILMACGTIGGFLSILTASGGPFATLPFLFLMFKRLPAQDAVFMTFAAGIVICTACGIVSMVQSDVDLGLSLVTFIFLSLGMPVGTKLVTKISKQWLKVIIAGLLVVLGGYALINFFVKNGEMGKVVNGTRLL